MKNLREEIVSYLHRRYNTPPEEEMIELCIIFYNLGLKNEFNCGKKKTKDTSIIVKSWRNDMSIYLRELQQAFESVKADRDWVTKREELFRGVDVVRTIEKSILTYWATENGWKRKKRGRGGLDWRQTFDKALNMSFNRVYKQKDNYTHTSSQRGFAV